MIHHRLRSLFLITILSVRHLARVPAAAVGGGVLALLLACGAVAADAPKTADAVQPRIVNLYNFIRNSDCRVQNSEEVLFNATRQQIELIKPTHLPATWALQYDALINPRYQKLLKEQLGPQDEIGAWWELPRQLVQKAGLKWRGHDHDWDWTANIGFSPGYAPDERRKLVDVYMADFKAIYGYYPKSVGSWFIDEVTLEHMVRKYGIVASCNCKDQVVSVTHDSALTSSSLAYGTLPVMDGSLWSGKEPAGIRPLLIASDGNTAPMTAEGPPQVKELNKTDLAISQPLTGGGSFVMVCREANVTCTGVDGQGKPLHWAWDMLGGDPLKAAVRKVTASAIIYQSGGADYELRLPANSGTFQQLPTGAIRILPNSSGQLVLSLGGL